MNNRSLFRFVTVLFAGIVVFAPWHARAFTIAPAIIELTVKPGETTKTLIRVENTSDTTKYYAFSVQKFIPKGNLGQQEFLPVSETAGLPEWVYFDRPILQLNPGESVTLPIVLRVPSDATPGGHYAAVFFSEQSTLESGSVGMVARTGALLLVTVEGNINKDFHIDTFSASSNVVSRLPVDFQTEISNQGNTHLTPEGEVRIQNMFGNTVASYPINPANGKILPASSRLLTVRWDKRSGDISGLFSGLRSEWRNFGFGKYTAHLRVDVDGQAKESQVVLWVFPWRTLILFGAVIILILGFIGVRRVVRK